MIATPATRTSESPTRSPPGSRPAAFTFPKGRRRHRCSAGHHPVGGSVHAHRTAHLRRAWRRLRLSSEAARALAKRLRLPRQRGNDRKALVAVDLAEITHNPMPTRSPPGHRAVDALKAQITELEDELAKMEMVAGGHRADFERERDRADRLMSICSRRPAS